MTRKDLGLARSMQERFTLRPMSNDHSAGCAWIEGEFVPIAHARIPIVDAGFTRSDCTYDVVAVWEGAFFRLDDHLARFERGWQKIFLEPPLGLRLRASHGGG